MAAGAHSGNRLATTASAITLRISNPQLVFADPPAALSVRGELQMGGNSLVDSRTDTSCGNKVGTLTTGNTDIQGNATEVWIYPLGWNLYFAGPRLVDITQYVAPPK